MAVRLSRVNKANLLACLDWRELDLSCLRTSNYILDIEQENFYESLSKRKDILLFSVLNESGGLVGICGFVNINNQNRNAEISLIINPYFRRSGYGKNVLNLLLKYGFKVCNFRNIFGEAYLCNNNIDFWQKYIEENNLFSTLLPERKYFNGKYHDSIYFNITKDTI